MMMMMMMMMMIQRQPVFSLPLLFFSVVCLAEKQQILVISLWFDPTGSGTHTRGEHANHYTTIVAKI